MKRWLNVGRLVAVVAAGFAAAIGVRAAQAPSPAAGKTPVHARQVKRLLIKSAMIIPGTGVLHDFLTAFLRDLGTGLEVALYEEAVMHCFGGKERVEV